MDKKFAVIEDHTLFAQALHMLVMSIHEFTDGHIYTNPIEFLNSGHLNDYDFLFIDLNMPQLSGVELILKLKNANIKSKVIVVSMINDSMVILKALEAGANGFIPKNTNFEELKTAIKSVDSGKSFVPEFLKKDLESAKEILDKNWENRNVDSKVNLLSAREIEIIKLIAQGYSNVEIGEKLYLSHLTVKTHRSNVLRKLGLKNSIALAKYASDLNLM